MAIDSGGRSPREIFESRMAGETLEEVGKRLRMNRKKVRQMELRYIHQLRKRNELAEKLRSAVEIRSSKKMDDDSLAMFWQAEDAIRGEWRPSSIDFEGYSYTHDDMVKGMRAQAKIMSEYYKDEEAADLFRQAADLHEQVVADGSYKIFDPTYPGRTDILIMRGTGRRVPKRRMSELDKLDKFRK